MNSMITNSCAVLVLAAGSSSRMGRPKQLLPWGEVTILQSAINNAIASTFGKVVVVLGAHSEAIQKILPSDVITVVNPEWQNGMGSSIACGMKYLLESKTKSTAVLITLGDQPLIDSEYLNSMLSTFRENEREIVATDYNGSAGVPALFGPKYFQQLAKLDAKFGAKELLARNIFDIHLLDAGSKTADIDTEDDYDKLNKLNR